MVSKRYCNKHFKQVPIIVWMALMFTALPINAKRGEPSKHPVNKGTASYYHDDFRGNRTSSGEQYDPSDFTAAHRSYPLNSILLITNKHNHRTAVVRVNDRGPYRKGRIVDVSAAAAAKLGMIKAGVAPVEVKLLTSLDRLQLQDTSLHAGEFRNCRGNVIGLKGTSIRVWTTRDLKHAFYVASDLSLEMTDKEFAVETGAAEHPTEYSIILTGITDREEAASLTNRLHAEGFGQAVVIE